MLAFIFLMRRLMFDAFCNLRHHRLQLQNTYRCMQFLMRNGAGKHS